MKAFQLKIVIKNSKPPIWRRVIIPAGITFSQLSMILNKVMGWCGYHMFEFEFYHEKIRMIEGTEDLPCSWDYDYIGANETFIREYLESNDWFTYTYDLGDNWDHRVTIEKIIEDYEYNYPMVIKYKGDCPIEDCGGIYGYYDCLDIISDTNNPEYESRMEWMESQGYGVAYDIEEVNYELEKEYFYKWGKCDNRIQASLYKDIFDGKYGLNATKRDKNRTNNVNVSGKEALYKKMDKIAEMLRQYSDLVKQAKEFNAEYGKDYSIGLRDVFSDYTKNDIVEIAKIKGVKATSGCSKNELIDKLVDYMLTYDVMKNYFLYQTDIQIEMFEKVLAGEEVRSNYAGEILDDIYQAAYIGMLENGVFSVPDDVMEAYWDIGDDEFDARRRQYSFVLSCLRAASLLYGIVPIDIFMQMLKKDYQQRESLTEAQVREAIIGLPPEFNEFVIKGNLIYHKDIYSDDNGLLQAQGKKKYYIPDAGEIIELATEGYLPNEKELKKMVTFLVNQVGVSISTANYVGKWIQTSIREGCDIKYIFSIVEEHGIRFYDERQVERFVEYVNELWNNTRMIVNRGFKPVELLKEEKLQPLSVNIDGGDIISFDNAKKKKVYPNDPCPCGSGKKYKNCCKNK